MEDFFKSNTGSFFKRKFVCALMLFCVDLAAGAQEQKQEIEKQIDQSKVPSKIIALISPYSGQIKKVKCYVEIDGNHESYEVKFYFKDLKYSIEFSKKPSLEDIEVDVKWNELDEEIQSAICDFLSKSDKYKVDKVQKQFSSIGRPAQEVIHNVMTKFEADIIRYELVVELKNEGSWKPFELLFDSEGNLIQQRTITKRTSDFILY